MALTLKALQIINPSVSGEIARRISSGSRRKQRFSTKISAMEVEVKLTLPDASAHERVTQLLAPYHKVTHEQENFFFDGSNGELSSKRSILRLRFYNVDARCVVSIKGKAVIVDGVSRVREEEEEMRVSEGREYVEDAKKLRNAECRLVKKVKEEFGCDEFVCLGGFENIRKVFEWEGEKLEVDETHYAFGTSYEIECETPHPELVKPMLQEYLGHNGVLYSHSTASKFAVFRSGKLPIDAAA